MSCFANQISGGIQCSKSRCHVLSARLNVVVPSWGISQLEYSPQLALVGPWAMLLVWGMCKKEEQKKTGRPGKGLQRSVAFIGILQGWDPPSFIFPSSPSPQWLPNGRDAILSACHVCSEFMLWSYNFWSLSFFLPVLVYPFNRILFPSTSRRESGLQSDSAGKTTRKWNKQLFSAQKSKFWLEFLELQYHRRDYVQLSPTAGYSSSLLVCFSHHQWVVAEDKFLSVWCYSWGFCGVPTQNFNCHKHLEICCA